MIGAAVLALELSAPLFGGAHAADFVTQQIALRRPGTREVNPLTRTPAVSLAVQVGTFTGECWLDRRLHGWQRWAFRAAVVGLHGYGTVRNIQAGRGRR